MRNGVTDYANKEVPNGKIKAKVGIWIRANWYGNW